MTRFNSVLIVRSLGARSRAISSNGAMVGQRSGMSARSTLASLTSGLASTDLHNCADDMKSGRRARHLQIIARIERQQRPDLHRLIGGNFLLVGEDGRRRGAAVDQFDSHRPVSPAVIRDAEIDD